MVLPRPNRSDPSGHAPQGIPGFSDDARVNSAAGVVSLLSAADIGRTIDRMAHEILERTGDRSLVLLGIPTRGSTWRAGSPSG